MHCILIVPPVLPDDPNYGVPSDHSTTIATPVTQSGTGSAAREYVTRTYRPLPDSGLREFGAWICSEGWEGIPDNYTPTEQVLSLPSSVPVQSSSVQFELRLAL